MSQEAEIQKTLEEIRKEKNPTLSSDLVASIVKIQADYLDHPAEAKNGISEAIEKFLNEKGN